MTDWVWLLLACTIAFITKLAGFLIPNSWLEHHKIQLIAANMTVGLLASLVTLNTFANNNNLIIDARLSSLLIAAILLYLRLPFLLVVAAGAVISSLIRLL